MFHFVLSGQPSKDPQHPDFVPTKFTNLQDSASAMTPGSKQKLDRCGTSNFEVV